jgi:hypothetical protein
MQFLRLDLCVCQQGASEPQTGWARGSFKVDADLGALLGMYALA